MSNSVALVGAPRPRETPYWEAPVRNIAWTYGDFEKPLIYDWQRVVRRTKHNAIRVANERLEKIRGLFKIGTFLVSQTHDQYMADYCTIKARACIQKLRNWNIDATEKAARTILPIIEKHDFEAETQLLKEYLNAVNSKGLVLATASYQFRGGFINCEEKNVLEKAEEKIERLTNKVIGLIKRVQDEDWWRRKMRRKQAQRIEQISRELHQIVVTRSAYCSPIGKREWKRRQQLNLDMLEHTLMENEDGEQFTLADLSETSVANPMVRRTELMVRIAGFEEHSKEMGYEGWFYTITTPSKFHAAHKSGNRNDKFNGSSPRDAQSYLCKLWARFRSTASRITNAKPYKWDFFGFRVSEPHHDGTPHWHLLLFIDPEHVKEVTEELKAVSEEEDYQELIGLENDVRFKAEKIKTGINPNTGKEYSAAGYIAKYIAKNIDGEHVDVDLYGNDAKASARDIVAWASRNGIRQFQQVGGPSVTAWRELRRLARLPADTWEFEELPLFTFAQKLDAIAQEDAPKAWKTYCEYYSENGIDLMKVLRTVTETIDVLTDEIDKENAKWLGEDTPEKHTLKIARPLVNPYGETGTKIAGIHLHTDNGTISKVSRTRTWQRVAASREKAAEVRQIRTAERTTRIEARRAEREAAKQAEQNGAKAPPWTGVNNCTEPPNTNQTTNPAPQQQTLFAMP